MPSILSSKNKIYAGNLINSFYVFYSLLLISAADKLNSSPLSQPLISDHHSIFPVFCQINTLVCVTTHRNLQKIYMKLRLCKLQDISSSRISYLDSIITFYPIFQPIALPNFYCLLHTEGILLTETHFLASKLLQPKSLAVTGKWQLGELPCDCIRVVVRTGTSLVRQCTDPFTLHAPSSQPYSPALPTVPKDCASPSAH